MNIQNRISTILSIESSKARLVIISIGLLWVIFHFFTLERSPIPNFDEAFFASMTHSVQEEGTLMLRMSTREINQASEIWLYGPVYFFTQAAITAVLGWGIWQFRLLNLLSGMALVIVMLALAKRIKLPKAETVILFLLLITDTALNSNMHSGRMDSLAMLLFTTGILFFFFPPSAKKSFTFAAGLFFSLAFLTTPRVGFLLLILPISFVLESVWTSKNRASDSDIAGSLIKVMRSLIWRYTIVFVIIIVPFFSWIQFRVGGLENYLRFFVEYKDLEPLYSIINMPAFYQLPALLIWLVAVGSFVYLSTKPKRFSGASTQFDFDNRILIIAIIPALFIIFIKGGYSVFLMAWVYLTLTYLSGFCRHKYPNLSIRNSLFLGCIAILFLNAAIFGVKSAALAISWNERNPEHFTRYFDNKGITNQNILGSFPYHFAIADANRFLSNDSHRELDKHKADELKIEHAFITQEFFLKDTEYFESLGFELVDTFEFDNTVGSSSFVRFIRKLPLDILWETNGVHLKRSLPDDNSGYDNR